MAVPRQRLTRAERREQLLDAAAARLAESGFDAITMEGVASAAGVSKGLGYAYFDNRDELLAALFDREVSRMDERVMAAEQAARAAGAAFADRLRAILEAGLDVVADRGAVIGALLRGKAPIGPLEHKRRARQATVGRYLTDLVIDEFGLAEHTAETAVGILLGGYAGALDLWIHRRATRDEITEGFVRLATGGLAELARSTAVATSTAETPHH